MATDVPPRLRALAAACATLAMASLTGCAVSQAAADINPPAPVASSAHPSATPAPAPTLPAGTRRFAVAGRSYLLSVPRHVRRPAPLVVAIGGIGWDARQTAQKYRLGSAAAAAHAVVAYPDPIDKLWNAGGCCWGAHADDVGFLSRMRAQIARKIPLDPNREWLVGFSNGGMLSYYAACADRHWTGIVILGASLTTRCTPRHPFSITNVNGEQDVIAPWDGGYSHYTRAQMPAVWRIDQQFATVFGCRPAVVSHSGTNQVYTYVGCRDGVTVRDIRVPGLHHHWPLRELDGYDMGPVLLHLALG
jgi:polyhydroxybutyrate depolymerase